MVKVPDKTSDPGPQGPLVKIEEALPAESRHRMEAGAGPLRRTCWREVAELMETSYRQLALKRMLAKLGEEH